MGTDERFERGRKVARKLYRRAAGYDSPGITGTNTSQDRDMLYFIERAGLVERRKGIERRN
jgi:hypothetical protein